MKFLSEIRTSINEKPFWLFMFTVWFVWFPLFSLNGSVMDEYFLPTLLLLLLGAVSTHIVSTCGVGTKTILFGFHNPVIHTFFIFIAWWKLYGFPRDPRLWVVFALHDIGYFGLSTVEGERGDRHPFFGARIVHLLFDRWNTNCGVEGDKWWRLSLLHSRTIARELGQHPSALCAADKLAFVITPKWIYLLQTWASGELDELMTECNRKDAKEEHALVGSVSSVQDLYEKATGAARKFAESDAEAAYQRWEEET